MRPAGPGLAQAPDTLNTMTAGAEGMFAAQKNKGRIAAAQENPTSKSKVEGWLGAGGELSNTATLPGEKAPPFGAPTQAAAEPGRPPVSGAAARLLAKSANEKIATFSKAIATTGAALGPEEPESTTSRSQSDPEKDMARQRAERAEEAEKVKRMDTRIRVTIAAVKHLPRMDTFGKTDAFCVVLLDNKKAGGQKLKRKTEVVKKNLNPEFKNGVFDFKVRDYPSQEIIVEVWDWDAGTDDERIGAAKVSLAPLAKADAEDKVAGWHVVENEQGEPVWGEDGSKTIVRVVLESNVDPADVALNMANAVGDPEEVRVLDCSRHNWDSAVRGLMFDLENHSEYPILVRGFWGASGRGKGAESCSYTIYRAPGSWHKDRCPCNRLFPCKYMWPFCGSFPSGRPNFFLMKLLCRCKPCTATQQGCCCWGECGPATTLAEPCCEGCAPCCTGDCACNKCLVPCCFPLMSCGCGCCTPEKFGGVGTPGIPSFRVCSCCSYQCCRNGMHRQHPSCYCCRLPCCPCNCTCNSTCCHCCRAKFHDRRRWTRITSGFANLPTDWGKFGKMPFMQDFERGGVTIPPGQRCCFYIHTPYPETENADHSIAIRGPFTTGFVQGDVTDQDAFLKIHAGGCTNHPVPFANSNRHITKRDAQYYKLRDQKFDQFQVCGFVGKVEYSVLPKGSEVKDCIHLCGQFPCTLCC
uniref:C2 domain-containing protein n=1 Tax=Hemiselmis andersenii TaxID=464988 RepID=A0A6U2BGX5_HEMAN|mmetsp:Transcript_15466/g.35614  ORF Transcript_15466/g.35614 Transcript_15466/m.35614 type:complete len:694 (+) Transcript_15466:203-2284(+)